VLALLVAAYAKNRLGAPGTIDDNYLDPHAPLR